MEFQLKLDFIELDNLLKAAEVIENGAQAKENILAGAVKVNGEVETRIRRKLRPGDRVEFGEYRIDIVARIGGNGEKEKIS